MRYRRTTYTYGSLAVLSAALLGCGEVEGPGPFDGVSGKIVEPTAKIGVDSDGRVVLDGDATLALTTHTRAGRAGVGSLESLDIVRAGEHIAAELVFEAYLPGGAPIFPASVAPGTTVDVPIHFLGRSDLGPSEGLAFTCAQSAGAPLRLAGNVRDVGTGALRRAETTTAGADPTADLVFARLPPESPTFDSRQFVRASATGSPHIAGITLRDGGGFVAVGHFSDELQIAGDVFPGSGGDDLFLAGIDAFGELRWGGPVAGAGDQTMEGFSARPGVGLAIAGHFEGQLDLGQDVHVDAPSSFRSFFAARLSETGEFVWSRSFEPTGVEEPCGATGTPAPVVHVAMDSGGEVYLAGTLDGVVDLGGGPLVPEGGNCRPDVFVARFDGQGNLVFGRRFGGLGAQTVTGLAVDVSGNAWIVGETYSTMSFDIGTVDAPASGQTRLYVAKIGPNGDVLHARGIGESNSIEGGSPARIAATFQGGVVVTSTFQGTLDVGLGPKSSVSSTDVYVAALGPAAEAHWDLRFEDSAKTSVSAVSVAPDGRVTLAGELRGTLDMGAGKKLVGEPENGILYVAILDFSGLPLAARGIACAPSAVVLSNIDEDLCIAGVVDGYAEEPGGFLRYGGSLWMERFDF